VGTIIIELVVIAAVAAGGLFAVHKAWDGFKTSISAPYVQAQIAADQTKLDAHDAAQKAAEADRDTAKANRASCDASLDTQKKASAKSDQDWKRKLTDSQASKVEADRKAVAAAPRIAQLQADAEAKPQLMECKVELAKARGVIQDELRRRRGLPATEEKK
jgi:hypothetical protein